MLSSTYNVKKVAKYRHRIISLLLNNKDLIDSILSYLNDETTYNLYLWVNYTIKIYNLLDKIRIVNLVDPLKAFPRSECLALLRSVGNNKYNQRQAEVAKTVWDSFIEEISDQDLFSGIKELDIDVQAYLARHLLCNLMEQLLASPVLGQCPQAEKILYYGKDAAGWMIDFKLTIDCLDITLGVARALLIIRQTTLASTEKLFVIDRKNILFGELPLVLGLFSNLEMLVRKIIRWSSSRRQLEAAANAAASAFKRYSLISAPVIDAECILTIRLIITEIINAINKESNTNLCCFGDLNPEESVFSPVIQAVKTRWTWLAINLCTAFISSRVIDLFEKTISHLVILAALMPIVAGIGGNTGNQTLTMIVRALALHQIESTNISRLLLRELRVGLINGIIWGGIMGVITWLLYGNLAMGGIMTLAMTLNLLVAALMGVIIPVTMFKLGRDPAIGSSVMITALTDTGGFFILLGLATLFLL